VTDVTSIQGSRLVPCKECQGNIVSQHFLFLVIIVSNITKFKKCGLLNGMHFEISKGSCLFAVLNYSQ
jgi:hypothetical protein